MSETACLKLTCRSVWMTMKNLKKKKHINNITIAFRMDLVPFLSVLSPFVSRQRYTFVWIIIDVLDALLHFTSIQSKQKHVINIGIGIIIEHLFDNNTIGMRIRMKCIHWKKKSPKLSNCIGNEWWLRYFDVHR